VQASLEFAAKHAWHLRESRRLLWARLRIHKKKAVETEGVGHCQFLAVIHSGGLNLTVQSLRDQVAEHLARWPEYYSGYHLFNAFEHYVSDLRKDGSGDELTLHVMAESLVRPIRVVSDADARYDFVVPPPAFIDKRCWGDEIVIAHQVEREFDWGWFRGHYEWVMPSEE